MEKINVNQLAEILGSKAEGMNAEGVQASRIVIDSRIAMYGDVFLAIKGPFFDGHDFIDCAKGKGAVAAIVEREIEQEIPRIVVEDTKVALQTLARHFLDEVNPVVVAVTGSTGKTTTKDMIHCALAEKFKAHKNEGNLNNDIGLPLTLLDLKGDHEAVVLEMGMNNRGEISTLAGIARPNIAVVTNIGDSHIGRLGSKENIFEAKMEICENMGPGDVLVINGNDEYLKSLKSVSKPFKKVFAGCGDDCGNEIFAKDVIETAEGSNFVIVCKGEEYPCRLKVAGMHNVSNAVLSFAAAVEAGVDPAMAVSGIEKFEGDEIRGKRVEINGIIFVNDTYNASPTSMAASLESFSKIEGRKIVVLGDMLELGEYAEKMHAEIGGKIAEKDIDCLMATGTYAEFYEKGAMGKGFPKERIFIVDDNSALVLMLKKMIKSGDAILFKGSHSTRMNDVYKEILKNV